MSYLASLFGFLQSYFAVLLGLSAAAILLSRYLHNGLNKYPGPLLAHFTDLWRFIDVQRRGAHLTHIGLHKQHGDVVRLGPNVLSFANPEAVKAIYGLNQGFIKSGFYPVQQATAKGQRMPSLFSTTDEHFHAQLRRSVNNAFSMSQLVQYEPGVDVVTKLFLERTEELFVKTGKECNFAHWLQYYAFDVIGQLTYSKSHGFIERDEDVDGIIGFLQRLFDYVAPIGQMPWLDLVLWKNPILRLLERYDIGVTGFPVVTFARARMAERFAELERLKDVEKQDAVRDRPDLLARFLGAKEARPDFFHDGRVLTMAISMAFAGSETTAISLAAVFYFLLQNQGACSRLMRELDDAAREGRLEAGGHGIVTWAESQALPYLDACIKEAFRLHPAAGLPLERVVPPAGADICGECVPGGTIVGCSAWVIHRRREVFGDDVDAYRPERWLEASPEARKEMEATMFQFGAGARTCIGKNISLLEIYKLVPTFLRRFDIRLAKPNQPWTHHNAWFVRQKDFNTRFELRSSLPKSK